MDKVAGGEGGNYLFIQGIRRGLQVGLKHSVLTIQGLYSGSLEHGLQSTTVFQKASSSPLSLTASSIRGHTQWRRGWAEEEPCVMIS